MERDKFIFFLVEWYLFFVKIIWIVLIRLYFYKIFYYKLEVWKGERERWILDWVCRELEEGLGGIWKGDEYDLIILYDILK